MKQVKKVKQRQKNYKKPGRGLVGKGSTLRQQRELRQAVVPAASVTVRNRRAY